MKRIQIGVFRDNDESNLEMIPVLPYFTLGKLAVHKEYEKEHRRGRWIVTHMPTGRSVMHGYRVCSEKKARRLARLLQSLNWDFDATNFQEHVRNMRTERNKLMDQAVRIKVVERD